MLIVSYVREMLASYCRAWSCLCSAVTSLAERRLGGRGHVKYVCSSLECRRSLSRTHSVEEPCTQSCWQTSPPLALPISLLCPLVDWLRQEAGLGFLRCRCMRVYVWVRIGHLICGVGPRQMWPRSSSVLCHYFNLDILTQQVFQGITKMSDGRILQ